MITDIGVMPKLIIACLDPCLALAAIDRKGFGGKVMATIGPEA